MKQSTEKKEYVRYTPEQLCEAMNKALKGKIHPAEESIKRIWEERKKWQMKELEKNF